MDSHWCHVDQRHSGELVFDFNASCELTYLQALGEMCILYPVSGGFYTLAVRFLDPSFAFAMGWNYWLQWAVTLPLEITVAGTTVQYWDAAKNVPLGAWITIFWAVIGE